MSHNVETMAYAFKSGSNQAAYQVPWHGLGVQVSNTLSPQEMLCEAGLNWSVDRVPSYIKVDGEEILTGKDVLVRSSDKRILTHITSQWNEVQNHEAFDLFSEWVKAGHMEMNSAGSLKNGSIVWALAKCNDGFSLFNGKDDTDLYLLFTNPHIYGQCIDIRATPIRVVCNNTLTLALEDNKHNRVKLNHLKKFDAEYVKNTLILASKKMEEYKAKAQFISGKKFNIDDLIKYYNEVFPPTDKKDEEGNVITKVKKAKLTLEDISRSARDVYDMLEVQPGAELGEGTWWSAYNSVTFALDHRLGRGTDTRMYSAWYGMGKKRKLDALNKAVEYAKAA